MKKNESVKRRLMLLVPVVCTLDDTGGSFKATFEDCTAHLGEDGGREVGRVAGCLGGGVQITDKRSGAPVIWYIAPLELWNAFEAAAEVAATQLSAAGEQENRKDKV